MKNVEIRQWRRWWKVIANGELVGRYDCYEDAKEIAIVCRHTCVWPPRSGVTGIHWHLGRWETGAGERFCNLDDAKESQERPYEHGHPYSKRTCLWLKGLPKLVPTKIIAEHTPYVNGGCKDANGNYRRFQGRNERDPKVRSKSFPGIARAMAEQWGGLI